MKRLLILACFVLILISDTNAQYSLSVNYSINSDGFYRDRLPLGIEFGYEYKSSKKISFFTALEVLYLQRIMAKTPFYDNYTLETIDPEYIWIIDLEKAIDRVYQQNSIILSPEASIHYHILNKEERVNLSLFIGANIALKVFDRYFISYVFYSDDLTEYRLEDRVRFENSNIYGVYLPLGFRLKLFQTNLILTGSYNLSLKRYGVDDSWKVKFRRRNGVKLGIGYQF